MLLNHNRFQPEIDWHQNEHVSVTSYTKCHKTNTRNFAEVSHPIQKTRELLTRLKGKIGDFQNFNGLFFKLWYLSSFMIFCPCQYRVLLGRIKTHYSLQYLKINPLPIIISEKVAKLSSSLYISFLNRHLSFPKTRINILDTLTPTSYLLCFSVATNHMGLEVSVGL